MNQITAPFNKEQIDALNKYQNSGRFHPFTCDRGEKECEVNIRPRDYSKDGVLIAVEDGWICPCGKYKQDWCHSFMAE